MCCAVKAIAVLDWQLFPFAVATQVQGRSFTNASCVRGFVRVVGRTGDGTACYNDCSGHGVCVEYQCQCDVGFHGEDCRTST